MFSGKVVLITGASSGIGAAAAAHFAREGAKLSLTGRDTKSLKEVAKKCQEESGRKYKFTCNLKKPLIITGDITVDDEVKNIFDTTIKTYGKLDILVNNAGWMAFTPVGQTNIDNFDKMFNLNVRSVYLLTNLAVPHLIKSKGSIVNISSVAGANTMNGASGYNMTKAALNHFTRCAAWELAPKKVRVNAVCPGFVQTNFQKNAGLDGVAVEDLVNNAAKMHPIGRVGNVDDVTQAIIYFASDKSDFITGQCFFVDGGKSVNSPMH